MVCCVRHGCYSPVGSHHLHIFSIFSYLNLPRNFDSDRDGHLRQREILEGARRLKEAALETKDPQMRQCVVDYLSLLAWAFKVNKALELNMRETVRALQKYMEPGEECDPNRVQILGHKVW